MTWKNMKTDLKDVGSEDGTGLGLRLMADVDISGIEVWIMLTRVSR
jgi:hypothetical protein